MANIFHIDRPSNKITLGTTDTTINIASHTASKTLALDSSKNLISIQDLRTSATPLFAGIIIADGGTIGQSAGPLLTFNDTINALGLTGGKLDVGNSITATNAERIFNVCDINAVIRCLRVHATAGAGFDLITRETADGADTGHWHVGTSYLEDFFFLDRVGGDSFRVKLKHGGGIALLEQATVADNVATYGKIWVKTATPNELMFTDDAGTDMLIAPLAYGEISVVGNAVETEIASQNVYVQVTVFDTNGENFKTTPDHTNDHLTITKAGRYFISCSITLNSIGGSGSTAEMEVKKNNGTARVGSLHVDRTLSGGGTESGAITITGIANLAVDDTIEVWIKNETNTQNYVVEDITLSLIQIGGA